LPRWAIAPTAERTYSVADEVHDAVIRPVARPQLDRGRAGYLVIAPSSWLEVAKPLLKHRRRQGLLCRAVGIESIYSEFGYGEKRPQAIREFLAHTYSNWKRAPHYVVLLGDGSYDFNDAMGTGARNHVPPLMVRTPYLWTASDPSYAAAHGDDSLPDLVLPAATRDEARVMIEKIIAFESGASDLGRGVTRLLLGEIGTSAMRPKIAAAFDEGASLVSYMGHGGIPQANAPSLELLAIYHLFGDPAMKLR
jgi:hypothetical protein